LVWGRWVFRTDAAEFCNYAVIAAECVSATFVGSGRNLV
jgi:hypothetical protein